jgi:hypothetical protein
MRNGFLVSMREVDRPLRLKVLLCELSTENLCLALSFIAAFFSLVGCAVDGQAAALSPRADA